MGFFSHKLSGVTTILMTSYFLLPCQTKWSLLPPTKTGAKATKQEQSGKRYPEYYSLLIKDLDFLEKLDNTGQMYEAGCNLCPAFRKVVIMRLQLSFKYSSVDSDVSMQVSFHLYPWNGHLH